LTPAALAPGRAALKGAAFFFCIALLASLSGCASVDRFGGSRQAVIDWGYERGFDARHLLLKRFRLLALQRIDPSRRSPVLSVYIEGDGAAWPTPYHPPRDPTPTEPVALAMAAADPAPAVLYLGRPCQYLEAAELAACSPEYWTSSRFAPRWSRPTWLSWIVTRNPAAPAGCACSGIPAAGCWPPCWRRGARTSNNWLPWRRRSR
jgi:hypothetical protein